MTGVGTQKVIGRITIIQEERFRLAAEDGRSYLFTLAHNADASADDLHDFHRRGTLVAVHFRGEPDLASAVAHRVKAIL